MHMQAIKPIWKGKKLEEAEAKQKKAEEEASASARRQAGKELEEEGKKLLSLEDSLKKAKTEQHAKEKYSQKQRTSWRRQFKLEMWQTLSLLKDCLKLHSSNVQRREIAKATNEIQKRVNKCKSTLLEHFAKKLKKD